MRQYDLDELRKAVKSMVDKKRYRHIVGVEYTAACLAMKYQYPIAEARVAGILHDCAKCIADEEMIRLCKKNEIVMSEIERKNPFLLHGKAGALLAEKQFEIKDEEILNAIRFHTTGRPNMSLLEQIIFTADYIEPGRNMQSNLEQIRMTAFECLENAVEMILRDTLDYLRKEGRCIESMSEETYQYYKNKNGNRKDRKL